jgi:hypothetical protein
MTDSPTPAVNHHADHAGFAGMTGLVVGVGMLVMGRGNGRLAVDLASVSDADRHRLGEPRVDPGRGAVWVVRAEAD